MCGIAGIVTDRELPDVVAHTRAMTAALHHRGPDGDGFWNDDLASFGHRRLSVLDLSPAGRQPMASHDGRFVLTFNGEIYNHLDLRRTLESDGSIAWRGHSDTETLVEALARWGVGATLDQANGMFAFALWDRTTRTLTLARDPFGEKPLLYALDRGALHFASEFTAFEAVPYLDTALSPHTVHGYLQRWYVAPPFTIGRGVRRLPEGSVLTWRPGGAVDVRSYWSISDAVERGGANRISDERDAVDALERLLTEAVQCRLLSDVPLGALLSGGIDSSLVTALMQRGSTRPVRTFSIGFTDPGYDEASHARAVAQHLGTAHTELYVSDDDARAVVPQLGRIYDEPFADSSQIPTVLVSRMARSHVTVTLTGDGGDELFGGYVRYDAVPRLWRTLNRVPARPVVASLVEHAPDRLLDAMAPVALRMLPRSLGDRHLSHLSAKVKRAGPLLRARTFRDLYSAFVGLWPDPATLLAEPAVSAVEPWSPPLPSGLSDVDWMLWWDSVHLLPDDLLVKVDRAAMHVGLETRVPLLDRRVAEFAWRLPLPMKLRPGAAKWPLQEILARHVPRALFERPKMGFGVPLDRWLRGPLRGWAEDLLSEDRLRRQGLLDAAAVQRAWLDFLTTRHRTSAQMWVVLMLQAWLDARGR